MPQFRDHDDDHDDRAACDRGSQGLLPAPLRQQATAVGTEAIKRAAATTAVVILRAPLADLLGKSFGGTAARRKAVADFLETDVGDALVRAAVGVLVPVLPGIPEPVKAKAAFEFQSSAAAKLAEKLLGKIAAPLSQAVMSLYGIGGEASAAAAAVGAAAGA